VSDEFTINAELPPGGYDVHVIDVELRTSQNDNEFLKLTFETADGTEVEDAVFLSQASYWRLKQFVKAIGIGVPQSGKRKVHPDELLGLPVRLVLEEAGDDDFGDIKVGEYTSPSPGARRQRLEGDVGQRQRKAQQQSFAEQAEESRQAPPAEAPAERRPREEVDDALDF
jgi:hypothetical protein